MKRYLILLLSLLLAVPVLAQSRREALLEYQARRRQAYTEFQENYRKAYSDYMRKRWEAFRSEAPVPVPVRREPDVPVVKQPDAPATPTQDQIPYDKVIEQPVAPVVADVPTEPEKPVVPEKPVAPEKPADDKGKPQTPVTEPGTEAAPAVDASRACRFAFYGTDCSVSLTSSHRFRLASLQENSVANAWDRVAGGSYDAVANECRELKKQLNLNDWGYYDLVRTLSDAFCGKKSGESVVLQAFLMAETGYKVRLARGDSDLYLLLALNDQVYERPYFQIDGQTFYLLDNVQRGASYRICNFSIPGERPMSLAMPEPPRFTRKAAAAVVRKTEDGKLTTKVTVNRNLIDFYSNYPPCYWNIYAATRLTQSTRDQFYPALRDALSAKSEYDAANLLLHYLHQAFPYKTDAAQFGRERTFFAEEMYYYPYSDCEDRSILFARLVKDLLKLDAVLLYYPNHIAAAVCFNDQVKGDYMKLGAKRYVICDPTYIGSNVGESMPDTKGVSAEVVKID
ncbi:hypothetical protein [uncultured Alistipes sp.]|jgi:hypothetical protein|uniref:hypothetical protein n=1 Tax=uncultured Alistipes sp. TaxID=538949 RepID=UPI0025CECB82|nr:hypothetical protein [uncultured Alistipes sp.]